MGKGELVREQLDPHMTAMLVPVQQAQKLRPQVILLGLASLLNDTASELIYPLLPVFLMTSLGATPAIIGVIEGAADGLASILKYFAGSWSDRMPRRKPLIVSGYGLATAARAVIALAMAWPLVLVARLTDRTGKGIRSAPRDALIADVTPVAARGKAYGFHRALDHAGAVAGPLLALLLLQGFGFSLRGAILFAIIPGAAAVLLLAFFLREEPRGERAKPVAQEPAAGPFPLFRENPRFRGAIAAISLFALANSSDAFLLLYAHAAGVPAPMLPLLWAAHHVIKALFSTRAGSLSDQIDRRWLLIAGWSTYALIYALFPFAGSMIWFVVLFIAYAIPFTLAEGAERAWISDLVPEATRGRSFGIYYLANGAGVLVGTAVFGLIYEKVSPAAAFFTGSALALMAVAAVLLTKRNAPGAAITQ
jgi:MFS family permease